MYSLKTVPYKTRLIFIYVSTTLLGIVLILLAIYNASREQLILDHLNTTYLIYSDRLQQSDLYSQNATQLAGKLSTTNFRLLPLNQLPVQAYSFDNCRVSLDWSVLQQKFMTSHGGILETENCLISWLVLATAETGESLLLLHHLDIKQRASIYTAYTNRIIIPLIFIAWVTIWGLLMLVNLVNQLQLRKDEVEYLAMHDELTGLPNRKFFAEKISEVIRCAEQNNKPFLLAMVDLNKFKSVNDELGHQYGDLLLKQMALRCTAQLSNDDVVARLGGDEFIILLNFEVDSGLIILERIYHHITEEYRLLGKDVCIGASIGVSCYPQHETVYSELMHKADIAMYRAKQQGGGIQLFESSMAEKVAIT